MNQVGSEDAETMVIHYAYDDLYRLTNADYTGAITATYAYDYDSVGNMTAFTETVNTVTSVVTRTFDAANRLETALIDEKLYTYAYDDNGNLLEALFDGDPMFPGGESGDCYDYNQRNLLTVVCTIGPANHVQVEYGYDGAGNRLWRLDRTGGGDPITTTYTNDVFGLTQVLVADDGTDQVYNLFGLDLIQQDDDSTVRTLLVDGLGSVRVETAGGSVGAVTTYSPYGEVLSQSGASGTVYGFTGEQEDEATGLLYLRARYYNLQLKVFQIRDPWEGTGWQPQTLNYYAYVHGNPIMYKDPSGHSPGDWWEELKKRITQLVRDHTLFSSTPKSQPSLSPDEQLAVALLNTTTTGADITALGLSGGGAIVEIGLLAVDTVSPIGDVAGVALYYEVINPVENAASLVAFCSTVAGDVIEGTNYIQLNPVEIGIGQDSLVSTGGIVLGNALPLEGVLDTLVNVPLVWYDVEGAAGNIPTLIEFRWNQKEGWYFIIYPQQAESSR